MFMKYISWNVYYNIISAVCFQDEQQAHCRIIEGHFRSPFSELIPGIMSKEVETARWVYVIIITNTAMLSISYLVSFSVTYH